MCVSGHPRLLRFVAQALSMRQTGPDTASWTENQVDDLDVGVTHATLLPKVPMKTPNQAFIGEGMA
jgi:hypothetical protein